ncbi:MAG: PEP-utilizing enzyme [archaeon]|jgi:phosphohistidine swiveling domain-containing protein|nr:PEP-utilizing enzyme [archaeon]
MYEGPPLKKRYFIEQLKLNLKGGMYIAKEFEENKKIIGLQEKLLERLSDNESEKKILSFPKRLIETKGHRKDAMYFGCFSLTKLLGEIAKRLGISIDQARFMTRQELLDALDGEFNDFELLNERFKYSVFYSVNGKRTFLVGSEARKWYKENVAEVKISETNELTGTPVFDGLVTGKVKVINHPNEIIKMEKGDILVSHATNPNLLPAMAKARAIVTDLGGLTCHAAIVSREFRIPCVIGTNIATQVLKDNDVVEVDAKNGIIKKKKN